MGLNQQFGRRKSFINDMKIVNITELKSARTIYFRISDQKIWGSQGFLLNDEAFFVNPSHAPIDGNNLVHVDSSSGSG